MQSLYIFLAILLGVLFPAAHELTFLIRYVLMIMLFFSFLKITFDWKILERHHLWILLLNFLAPAGLYAVLRPLDWTLAMAVFITAIAPTAAVAPVIAGFLRARVEFVTAAVILTSPAVALVLPLLLPFLLGVQAENSVWDVLWPVVVLVFGPLLLTRLVRRFAPRLTTFLLRWPTIPFYLFLVNVHIASADATVFIRNDTSTSWPELLRLVVAIGLLCIFLFQVGERLRPGAHRYETGLALGRKNTMFGLWVALTFINPVVALGPILYIFWQNLYNGWQMWQEERKGGKT